MDEYIARANIKHFRTKLETETNEAQRTALLKLLADEEQKLQSALEGKRKKG